MSQRRDFDTDVVRRFGRIQNRTECTYARGARLIGAASSSGWHEGLDQLRRAFHTFTTTGEDLDGVVYEIPSLDDDKSIECVASTTAGVLSTLTQLEGRELDQHAVLDPSWWFTVGDRSLFVSVFAPCYPPQSSRYSFGCTEMYILFLASEAFRRRRRLAATELPPEMKQSIRAKFDNAGRPYDLQLTLSKYEAFRVVKPVLFGEAPVAWWEEIPDDK